MTTPAPHAFTELLTHALSAPGKVHEAYSAFHDYSIGNQLLALMECHARGIEPGPLATFPRWKGRGRYVRKGEKALTLCMPITVKRQKETDDDGDEATTFTRFVYKPRWFVLAQTDGQPFNAPPITDWQKDRALTALNVTEEPFAGMDGNSQGYARARSIAVSPLAALPYKTTFHELAHVLFRPHRRSRTDGRRTDAAQPARSRGRIRRDALLCCVTAARHRIFARLYPALESRRRRHSRTERGAHFQDGRSNPPRRTPDDEHRRRRTGVNAHA
jgi:hypothetical protein